MSGGFSDLMSARCCISRCGGAGAESSSRVRPRRRGEKRRGAHQSRIPRRLLLVPGGDPLHAHHFAEQILILPLVALLFLAGGRRQLLFLTVDGMETSVYRLHRGKGSCFAFICNPILSNTTDDDAASNALRPLLSVGIIYDTLKPCHRFCQNVCIYRWLQTFFQHQIFLLYISPHLSSHTQPSGQGFR